MGVTIHGFICAQCVPDYLNHFRDGNYSISTNIVKTILCLFFATSGSRIGQVLPRIWLSEKLWTRGKQEIEQELGRRNC